MSPDPSVEACAFGSRLLVFILDPRQQITEFKRSHLTLSVYRKALSCRIFSWELTIHRRPWAVYVPMVGVSVVSKAYIYFWWRPLPKWCFWRQWANWNILYESLYFKKKNHTKMNELNECTASCFKNRCCFFALLCYSIQPRGHLGRCKMRIFNKIYL